VQPRNDTWREHEKLLLAMCEGEVRSKTFAYITKMPSQRFLRYESTLPRLNRTARAPGTREFCKSLWQSAWRGQPNSRVFFSGRGDV